MVHEPEAGPAVIMDFHTYNRFHLGDNLLHLHFLRHLALKYPEHTFIHAV